MARRQVPFFLIASIFLIAGCGEDKLSDDMDPEITRVMESIRIDYPEAHIPEGLNAEFTVYGLFNDLTEEEIPSGELAGKLTWSSESDDAVSISSSGNGSNRVSFTGIGMVRLTAHYHHNEQHFSDQDDFEITPPVIASIDVEEVLDSPELTDCCSQIVDAEGKLVLGCVRRFQAIATYDNGFVADQSADTINWSTSSNLAQVVESASGLADFPETAACISELSSTEKKGLIFAHQIGTFSVNAKKSGVTGRSSEIKVIVPTLMEMEFSLAPQEMIVDDEALFSAMGRFNNDTTGDVTDLVHWWSSNETYGVFLNSHPSGTFTAKELPIDSLTITASHLTAADITTDIEISEKILESVYITPTIPPELRWNDLLRFSLMGEYNNEKHYPLNAGIKWSVSDTDVAIIDSDGLLTAQQPQAQESTADVNAVYDDNGTDFFASPVSITVSSETGELIEIHAMPSSVEWVEGETIPVTVKGFYSNQSQQNVLTSSVSVSQKPAGFDVSSGSNLFYINAPEVNENQYDLGTIEFTHDASGKTAQINITAVYNSQVRTIELLNPKREILEQEQVQLAVSGDFIGPDNRILQAGDLNWRCSDSLGTDCSGSIAAGTGLFTAPELSGSSETFTLTAVLPALQGNFPDQLTDVSDDTTVTVYPYPTVQFTGSDPVNIDETCGSVSLQVQSSSPAREDMIIPFTVSGTADDGADYSISNNERQFVMPRGQSTALLHININNDTTVETDETIIIEIDAGSLVNAEAGSFTSKTIQIQDSNQSVVSFVSDGQTKNENTGTCSAEVRLDIPSLEEITVSYELVNSPECSNTEKRQLTAGRDSDAVVFPGIISFAASETSSFIQFDISDDSFHETDECLEIQLTGVQEGNAVLSMTKPTTHTVIIRDDDPLKFDASPDTSITNTGDYTYTTSTTAFDASIDHWVYSVYNVPAWLIFQENDPQQSARLSGTPSKNDVGIQEKEIVICISDADQFGAYSIAHGAQTVCQPFKINVLTCQLQGNVGNIHTASDFTDTAHCGKPENHVTLTHGKTLNMDGDHFNGMLILEAGSSFSVNNGTMAPNALVDLLGGSLTFTGTNTIDGHLTISADTEITIQSGGSMDLTTSTFPVQVSDNQVTIVSRGLIYNDETNPVVIGDNGQLVLSGADGVIGHVKLDASEGVRQIEIQSDSLVHTLEIAQDSTLYIEEGKTLIVENPLVINENVCLTISGTGMLQLNGQLTQEENSSFVVVEGTLDLNNGLSKAANATLLLSGATLDIRDTTVSLADDWGLESGDLMTSVNTVIDTGSHQMVWYNSGDRLHGRVDVGNGTPSNPGSLTMTGTEADVSADINLDGGTLDIDQTTTVSGTITHRASSTIDVAESVRLRYNGPALNIGPLTLTLKGGGHTSALEDFQLNHSSSMLRLEGEDGELNKVRVTADIAGGHGIMAEANYVIRQLSISNHARSRVTVADGKTLVIGNQLIAESSGGVLLGSQIGSGKIVVHDIYLYGDLELQGELTLAADATLYVINDASLTISSDYSFNDGLIVTDGAQLTIESGDGYPHEIVFSGGYDLGSSGAVVVADDITMSLSYSEIEADDWGRTTVVGTGRVNPGNSDPQDVINFRALPDDGQISLTWDFQSGDYDHVLIRKSENDFPASPSDGDWVFDGTDASFDDAGLADNGIRYFYTAFAYKNIFSYASGVKAMAAATVIPDALIGYYLMETGDCGDYLLDSSGFGNHGRCLSTFSSVEDRNGVSSKALHFGGIPDAIELDNPLIEVETSHTNQVVEDFSISFWIRTTQTGGDDSGNWFHTGNVPLIDGKMGVDQNDFGVALANGNILFGMESAGTIANLASLIAVNDGTWHHVVVTRTFSSGQMEVTIDGFQTSSTNGPANAILDSAELLFIGRRPYRGNYFQGELDDIRFYGKVLSGADIQTLFEN